MISNVRGCDEFHVLAKKTEPASGRGGSYILDGTLFRGIKLELCA